MIHPNFHILVYTIFPQINLQLVFYLCRSAFNSDSSITIERKFLTGLHIQIFSKLFYQLTTENLNIFS